MDNWTAGTGVGRRYFEKKTMVQGKLCMYRDLFHRKCYMKKGGV